MSLIDSAAQLVRLASQPEGWSVKKSDAGSYFYISKTLSFEIPDKHPNDNDSISLYADALGAVVYFLFSIMHMPELRCKYKGSNSLEIYPNAGLWLLDLGDKETDIHSESEMQSCLNVLTAIVSRLTIPSAESVTQQPRLWG